MLLNVPRDWEAYYREFSGPPEPAFVVWAAAGLLPPGPVLDLAGGAGRNAFFLARRGHSVTLLEKSAEALFRVRRRALEEGLFVEALAADLEAFPPPLPAGPYVGVVLSYFVHRPLLEAAATRLLPGGLFLVEGFTRREAVRRGRASSPHYWEPGELFTPPAGLSLVAAGEGERGGKHRAWAVWRKL